MILIDKLVIYKKMKRVILILLVTVSISKLCLSQDVITLRTGEEIRSKIQEIGQTEIKYKKFDNQTGPVYVVAKSDVSNILYENGTKDLFSNGQTITDTGKANPVPGNTITSKGAPVAETTGKTKFLIGFSGVFPTGTWPATALTNMGTTSFLKGQGSTVKSYGFGIMIQGKISTHFSLFFDVNTYDYNIFLAKKGADVQSVWTVAESATHWDEAGAPQIQYVHNLPTDVHFDMQATGFRLGGKFVMGNNNIHPWAGAAFGLYKWTANYYNEDKSKSYGKDDGYATGLTFLLGIDLEPMIGIVITPFIDLASPVATYKMTGLFYPQWDIEYNSHIMGTNRFGVTISFSPISAAKK
jgi:hypothetical protein